MLRKRKVSIHFCQLTHYPIQNLFVVGFIVIVFDFQVDRNVHLYVVVLTANPLQFFEIGSEHNNFLLDTFGKIGTIFVTVGVEVLCFSNVRMSMLVINIRTLFRADEDEERENETTWPTWPLVSMQ